MIIPVRCFTCGKVIGNKWETYLDLLQAEYSEGCAAMSACPVPTLLAPLAPLPSCTRATCALHQTGSVTSLHQHGCVTASLPPRPAPPSSLQRCHGRPGPQPLLLPPHDHGEAAGAQFCLHQRLANCTGCSWVGCTAVAAFLGAAMPRSPRPMPGHVHMCPASRTADARGPD